MVSFFHVCVLPPFLVLQETGNAGKKEPRDAFSWIDKLRHGLSEPFSAAFLPS